MLDRHREALSRAGDHAALEPVRAALGMRRDEDLVGAEGAQGILSTQQINALAKYVASVAGK